MRHCYNRFPDCVPEYYRDQQEKRDRQYDMAIQHRAHYLANQRKLGAADRSGLAILSFGGYVPCWEFPSADHDTMSDGEDDIGFVICHDPYCRAT